MGQGAQKVGMGLDLYNKDLETKELFDSYPNIRDLCFYGPDTELNQTKNTQKSILLESYAVASYLKRKGIEPSYVAGLSLGEYSALTFSEAFDLNDAIDIVSFRGELMQNALPLNTSGMAAVIGSTEEIIKECISQVDGVIGIANYNSPAQIVITGEIDALNKASALLKDKGYRVIPLKVSGAFHSPLLNDASFKLKEKLSTYEINNPKYKMVYNSYGTESNDNIVDILTKQIKSSVYFYQSILYMIEEGVDTFVEVGVGSALSGFVKKTNPNVKVYTTNSLEDIDKVVGDLCDSDSNR
ncbi:MAG: ACP S-malonyltransferase [Anaeroplasmataceae bacterium]